MISTADARRLTTVRRVAARLEAAGPVDGCRRLRRVLADLDGELSHSATEAKARRLVEEVLARHGLALHPRPLAITLDGRRVGEADLPVLALRLDLEIDGPHHDLPEQRGADRRRDRLIRRAGWNVERFPAAMVDLDPCGFARAVDELVVGLLPRRSHP